MDKSGSRRRNSAFVFNAYDDCVASIDEQIGRLFDELDRRGRLDRTWVILVSDHGESFGEHAGVFLHGIELVSDGAARPARGRPAAGDPDQAGCRGDGQPPQRGRDDR